MWFFKDRVSFPCDNLAKIKLPNGIHCKSSQINSQNLQVHTFPPVLVYQHTQVKSESGDPIFPCLASVKWFCHKGWMMGLPPSPMELFYKINTSSSVQKGHPEVLTVYSQGAGEFNFAHTVLCNTGVRSFVIAADSCQPQAVVRLNLNSEGDRKTLFVPCVPWCKVSHSHRFTELNRSSQVTLSSAVLWNIH